MKFGLPALSALGALVLGACADAPTSAPARAAAPAFAAAAAENGQLERVASARSNKVEPKGAFDRGRFNITVKYLVEPTAAQRDAFETAAARWERVVVADVPSVSGTVPSCFAGQAPVSTETIDDIVIEVVLQPIDGPGKVLGSAGPCYARSADNLPLSGRMFFDTADLASLEARGLFDEVIVHEMGHVLGIGTLWNYRRTLRQGPATDPYFSGKFANTHWNAEGGEALLPVENIGGPGTAGGHWRESVLRNELMTGFINLGENPLSRITAGSLRDLGYGVGIVGEQYELAKGAPGVTTTTEAEGVNIAEGEVLLPLVGVVDENDGN